MSPLDRYVDRAVRMAQKRGVRIALSGYLIFFTGIVGERYISSNEHKDSRSSIVKSGTAVAVDGCNARFEDRMELRNIFFALRSATLARAKAPNLPEAERARLMENVAFYDARLKKLRLPDCRDQLHVLSDDPDAEVRVPTPKHP